VAADFQSDLLAWKELLAVPKRLKTGLSALKSKVRVLGVDAIDRRSAPARALEAWRAALVADLGGEGNLSAQQMTVVELARRTCLLLSHIDSWLLAQKTLVIKRRRTLIPAVLQRQQLADALSRYMQQLGLERIPVLVSSRISPGALKQARAELQKELAKPIEEETDEHE
jgi:hypothetical protein